MLHPISQTAFSRITSLEEAESNGLIKLIENHIILSSDCKFALMKTMTRQTLQNQDVLLEEGKINDKLYCIETGLIRFYADVTTGFYSEGDFFCSFSSFFHKSALPSLFVQKNLRFCTQFVPKTCKGYLANTPN